MYNYSYFMNLTCSRRATTFDVAMIDQIKKACSKANGSTNSIRFGRKFSYTRQIDNETIQILLESKTPVENPQRSVSSSISRSLVKICPKEIIEKMQYNGSILAATFAAEELPDDKKALTPSDIIQEVVDVFLIQTGLKNADKEDKALADETAIKIRGIIEAYKEKTHVLND